MKKMLTKQLSLLLAFVMIISLVPMSAFATEVSVAKIEVVEGDILYENAGGKYVDSIWNPNTGGYEACEEYYYYQYDTSNVDIKITYSDGSVKYSYYSYWPDYSVEEWITCTNSQDEGAKWTKNGNNKITFEYMGKTCDYNVQILDNPVVSIAVVEGDPVYEGAYAYYNDYMFVEEGYYMEWPEYGIYGYNSEFVNLKITYVDGSVKYSNYEWLPDEDIDYDINAYTFQDHEGRQWIKGGTDNTVVFEYMGKTCEYNVEIAENPVASIEVVEQEALYENTNGYWHTGMVYEDLPATAEEYYHYGMDPTFVNLKVTYTDGTIKYSNYEYADIDDEYIHYEISYDDCDQGYNGVIWTVGGTNLMTFEYMGKTCEYNVQIQETPVASLEILKVPAQTEYEYDFYPNLTEIQVEIEYKDGTKTTEFITHDDEGNSLLDGKDVYCTCTGDGYKIEFLGATAEYEIALSFAEENEVVDVMVSNVSSTGDGMIVNVKGNIGYSEYEDNVSVKKEITSIVLSKVEDEADFKTTFTQTILLDSNSIGKKDEEKNTIALSAYVVDYVGNPKINGKKVAIKKNVTYPKQFEVAINDNPEITAKMLQRFFKVKKKNTLNVLTVVGDLIEGAAIVNVTEDDIPDDIKELIEMGLYSEDEAKAKCAVGGNNRERRMVIIKPDITYVGQDDDRKPTVACEAAKYEDSDLYFYAQALNDAGVETDDEEDTSSEADSDDASEEDDLLAMLDNM